MSMRRWRIRAGSDTGGFTLIELLVVVIMVGVLAAIAAPSWFAYAKRQQMNRARSDLLQVLQTAQSDAQRLNSERVVRISSASPPTVEVGATPTLLGEAEQNRDISIAGSVWNGTATVPSTTITIDHKGSVSAAPFVFSVTGTGVGGSRCVVVTTIVGNLELAEGNQCNPSQWLSP